MNSHPIPLSLYIHLPWCVKKCPYCDFNSYAAETSDAAEQFDRYVKCLKSDLEQSLDQVQNREIISIFFGGGTPSLFPVVNIETILNQVNSCLNFSKNIEITLEANPGTLDNQKLQGFKNAGINRISLGAQSFQEDKLHNLGRIHKVSEITESLSRIQSLNFNSFNIDLMYGLPNQTLEEGLADLEMALSFDPPHISWYHLTLEPNTVFHRYPPQNLPEEEAIWDLHQAGLALLAEKGYLHYEISAFSKPDQHCRHNVNYWQFGDYLGIGAGAHGKITYQAPSFNIQRYSKKRYPKSYLATDQEFTAECKRLSSKDSAFEFLLNHLRLEQGFTAKFFEIRTGCPLSDIHIPLQFAQEKNLLVLEQDHYRKTEHGRFFLNDLLQLFM